MKFRELLGKELLFFDGGMGTMLQAAGLSAGEIPEHWNMEKPELVMDIHYQYAMAGANIIETNAFGANPIKFEQDKYSSYDIMYKAVKLCQEAIKKCKAETERENIFVAAGLGPSGALLEPLGPVTFDESYESYKTLVLAAKDAGADLILLETMNNAYEIKSAVLAAKENCNLPIVVSAMLDENGKLLTGGDIRSLTAMLEGLGVDGLGLNCGFGPDQIAKYIPQYIAESSLPVMVNANAGMPQTDENGNTVWGLGPEEFAEKSVRFIEDGVYMIGGCCGTTPAHIAKLVEKAKGMTPPPLVKKHKSVITSNTRVIEINDDFAIIGEKINPTGNKQFKEALKNNDMSYALRLAKEQLDAGAHIIDVNVGLPEIDEVATLPKYIKDIQAVVDTPLMIDTSNAEAMEKAARYYNGKPFINSVSGKKESLKTILPIAAKYGGMLIALTLDDDGIPSTSEGRVAIARKIIAEAAKYGIEKKDIVVDPLVLTVSADKNAAVTTLETIKKLHHLGIKTSIGVSNVSFGLPQRDKITSTFFAFALSRGLNAAIMNPFSEAMMDTYRSYRALVGHDINCKDYIAAFENTDSAPKAAAGSAKEYTLIEAIVGGLKDEAYKTTAKLGETTKPLDIINDHIIKALDEIGAKYEQGTAYLPQLLTSADAAKEAFVVIKELIEKDDSSESINKGKIVIATVKGDVHDIGKNIVKVLLENYGYEVIDLGKDVAPETIVETVEKEKVHLVGLSALMTTTVVNMEETIKQLRAANLDCKIVVGGAVLNEQYAASIGADFYCKDAMATVKYAEQLDIR